MAAVFNMEVAHAIYDIVTFVSLCVFAANRYNRSVGTTRSPVCDGVAG